MKKETIIKINKIVMFTNITLIATASAIAFMALPDRYNIGIGSSLILALYWCLAYYDLQFKCIRKGVVFNESQNKD